MNATEIVVDRPFRRVTIMLWTIAALTALNLVADILGWESGLGRLGRASLIAALVACGFVIVLRLRTRRLWQRNEEGYATLFESYPLPILLADNTTLRIIAANKAASEKYGYGQGEFAALSILDVHRPEDWDDVLSAWAEIGKRSKTSQRVATHVTKDGTFFPADIQTTTLKLNGRCIRVSVVTDVTDRDEALAHTRESCARYCQIVETAGEGILIASADATISVANERAAHMLGYSVAELVGHRVSEFYGVEGAARGRAAAAARGVGGEMSGGRKATLRHKNGTMVPVLLHESGLLDREGRLGQLGMITDLTERDGLEDELAFQAAHDPLTGLPNRLLLIDRLQAALERAKPGTGDVVVVSLDVDGFKDLNSAHGDAGGDKLLVEIGGRLSKCVREHDTVARFGGDEFVIVSDGTGLMAETLVECLGAAMGAPYFVGGVRADITVSMGVAVGHYGDRPSMLLRGADMALLQAKVNGRGCTEFFTEALRATSRQRLETISDLRRAVERNEFSLRFQPVVSLTDESIIGAEALIRWEHPRRGTLGPLEFISVAEETGLIDPIGRWVIEETCRRFAGWQRLAPDLSISLNISARQLATGALDDIVREAIKTSGVDPSRLALEVTEAVLMDDVELAARTLTAVRETGVAISVDDFGTGYSSLSRLKKFPVDVLKIDRSFVVGLPEDAYDTALVQAVVAIAEALQLSVIAEGVENGRQAQSLLDLGCYKAQGYHFYRPLTAEDFEAVLIASRLTHARVDGALHTGTSVRASAGLRGGHSKTSGRPR